MASPAVQSRLTSLTVRYFTVMCKDDVEAMRFELLESF